MSLDPEYMEAVRERAERIRDHVPAEEFCIHTAASIARQEIGGNFDDLMNPSLDAQPEIET